MKKFLIGLIFIIVFVSMVSAEELKTYSIDELEVEFELPLTWEKSDYEPEDPKSYYSAVFWSPTYFDEDLGTKIDITISTSLLYRFPINKKSAKEYISELKRGLHSTAESEIYNDEYSYELTKVSDLPAIKIDLTIESEIGNIKGSNVIINEGNRTHIIEFYSNDKEYTAYVKVFNSFLNSYKIKNPQKFEEEKQIRYDATTLPESQTGKLMQYKEAGIQTTGVLGLIMGISGGIILFKIFKNAKKKK